MSRLEEIAQKIRSLPDIQSERDRIAITVRVSDNAKETARGLRVVFKQAPHIDILTRGKMIIYTNDAITYSIQQGTILKKMIRRDKFGSEKKISEHLENLAKKLQGLESQRNQAWALVQREAQKVQTILDIATTLNLESISALTAAIKNFQSATTSPPSSAADVERIVEARKENDKAIAKSGLSGNVQKILEGAINQKGDPRLLFEADVQIFLNEHPALWEILKLKLA